MAFLYFLVVGLICPVHIHICGYPPVHWFHPVGSEAIEWKPEAIEHPFRNRVLKLFIILSITNDCYRMLGAGREYRGDPRRWQSRRKKSTVSFIISLSKSICYSMGEKYTDDRQAVQYFSIICHSDNTLIIKYSG